jgi:hypothetical protein
LAASGHELAPGARVIGAEAKVLLSDVSVENVELKRRPRDAALLELPGHGEEPLDERGEILARNGSTPGVGSGSPVAKDPTSSYETLLALRPEVRYRFETLLLEELIGQVELRLHVGLFGTWAEVARVSGGAEEEADRLGEDRLSRAGLAGDRVQPRAEREVGLADEDEVLDAKTAQH